MKPDLALTRSGEPVLDPTRLLRRDYVRLRRQWARLRERGGAEALAAALARAEARFAERLARAPAISYAPELPVSERADEIASLIRRHPVVVVTGETGSGKTTQLPKIALAAGRGRHGLIGHTQPRRIAARSVAERIAAELGEPLGVSVGFKVRFTDRTGEGGFIKLMTDGILLAETQGDRDLDAYDTIIIDEAHERSLNIDFLLGYLKQLLPRRPELRVIITSATIDAQRFAEHFSGPSGTPAPLVEVSGRSFPIEVRYRPVALEEQADDEEPLEEAIADAIEELWLEGAGDVLVFLPGEREIRETQDVLRARLKPGTEILPLYARLSVAEQQRVFTPSNGRRVVLSTNVAETSLTVPGIRYVVDTGLVRLARYSVRNKVQQLGIEKISQASAKQRAGRCGRTGPGVAVRLYSEEDLAARSAFTPPEILRTSLAGVILRLAALGFGRVETFPFIEPPSPRAVADGITQLVELGAIDPRAGSVTLTELGRQLARIPVDPRIGRMLVEARKLGVLAEVLVIAAALSVPDPRERPFEAREAAERAHQAFADPRSDFLALLKIWRFFAELSEAEGSHRRQVAACRERFLSWLRLREWRDLHAQLKQTVEELGWPVAESIPPDPPYEAIHRALLPGLLSHVGVKSDQGDDYLGARGIRFWLHPASSVTKKNLRWVVAAELSETSRLYARTVARIEPEWLEQAAAHLVTRNYLEPRWDDASGQVIAQERVSLYGLTIVPRRRVHYGRIAPAEAHQILCAALAARAVTTRAPFAAANQRLIESIEALEARTRRCDLLVSEETLAALYAARLPGHVVTRAELERWCEDPQQDACLRFTREELLRRNTDEFSEALFPDTLRLGDFEVPVSYRFEPGHPLDGVTARVPLALLNAVEPRFTTWLVPGLVRERVAVRLKALPKAARARLQPQAETVTAFLELTAPHEQPLERALLVFLRDYAGLDLPDEVWARTPLPPHLELNVQVVGVQGEEIAMGRDLAALQRDFGEAARLAFQASSAASHQARIEQSGLTSWRIGTLPERITVDRPGGEIVAFPALVDEGETVAVRVFETATEAARAHREGVLRLLSIALKVPLRAFEKGPPGFAQAALALKPVVATEQLLADFQRALASRALLGDEEPPRSEAAFREQLARAKPRIGLVAEQLGRMLAAVAEANSELQAALTSAGQRERALVPTLLAWRARLLHPRFLSETPWPQLPHLPRYLRALKRRLTKFSESPEREARHGPVLAAYWQRWEAECARRGADAPPALLEFRWWLEELHVSLFAQELKTPFPVSVKRLEKFWNERLR
ncbi:MAG: ATP-dependent RNA helicase HrpA [Casimicrobiaceae bacterium]|nr:ATP-dependent RNA helicase HrpA [Casimicrobiaceae bacterium]MDW8311264.1 ATP-dependent RNA helicase HrpA [Burkholderiales bacterium]